jgi:hypothetical protein
MMKGRSLLAIGATAVTMIITGVALAQAPGSQPGTGADHHPTDPKASEKPGATGAQAQGSPMGPGMMQQPGMMGPGMMRGGRGMMGPGMMQQPGMMGPGMMRGGRSMMMGHHGHHGPMMGAWGQGRRIYLSTDDVKRIVDGQLAWRGLKRLKVGAVKVVNNDTVAADIVTKDGSLAVRLHVDRHTGRAVIAD